MILKICNYHYNYHYYYHLIIIKCKIEVYKTINFFVYFVFVLVFFFLYRKNNSIVSIINEELKSFYARENTHIYCYNFATNRVLKRLEVWELHIPILCDELEGQILPLVLQNS